MKKFMRRDHAELLKRQYMGMALGHDILLGLMKCEARSHGALSRKIRQHDLAASRTAADGEREHARCMNS